MPQPHSARPLPGDPSSEDTPALIPAPRRRAPRIVPQFDLFASTPPVLPAPSRQPLVSSVAADMDSVSPYRFRLTDDVVGMGGAKARAAANLTAIALTKSVEVDGRPATPDERRLLAEYVGWGGLPQAFESHRLDWREVHTALRDGTTAPEFAAARASTPTAFYTPLPVIRAVYAMLDHLGVLQGIADPRVLEPGAGVGHFIGAAPEHYRDGVRWTAIEMDELSGRIARLLYPEADVRIEPFERARLPRGFFHAILANVPWGNFRVDDAAYRRLRLNVGDYFIARSLDLLAPGGTLAAIVGRATMDKENPTLRRYAAERADLTAAIRLPDTTFADAANTVVTSDLLLLRKRGAGDAPTGPAWLGTREMLTHDGEPVVVNEYYAEHPARMLGAMRLVQRQYRKEPTCHAPLGFDVGRALAAQIATLPLNGCRVDDPRAVTRDCGSGDIARIAQPASLARVTVASDDLKEGAFTVSHGSLMVQRDGALVPAPSVKRGDAERVVGMIELRDATRATLAVQLADDAGAIATTRVVLNDAYDRFRLAFGPINLAVAHGSIVRHPNLDAFRSDPDVALVAALELYDADRGTAEKAPIFTTRVIAPHRPPTHVERAEDALLVSLDARGCVDLAYMSGLTHRTVATLASEFAGLIYEDPESGRWLPADEYLSGEVRAKLRAAQGAAQIDARFAPNVAALARVQPQDLMPSEIDVALGAPWIESSDVEQFVTALLDARPDEITVSHIEREAEWRVTAPSYVRTSAAASKTWGTDRVTALTLIEDALNQRLSSVYDLAADGRRVFNADATLAAREKQSTIKTRFAEWVWEEPVRAARLATVYNERYNHLRRRVFDGAHVTLSGASEAITLRPHQKDAVWRVISSGNTGVFHHVGAGKTMTLAAAAMESRRLGLLHKPLIAVPNHCLLQWAAEWMALYPNARLLIASKDDFARERRKAFCARIATGDWDAIVMTHASFARLPLSAAFEREIVQEELDDIAALAASAKESGDRASTKELERAKKRYAVRLAELANREAKDDGVTFEELGVDCVMIDEADAFKNLFHATKVQGLSRAASQRAWHLYMVTRYLHARNPGRGVVFATGTPIANSVAELWTMMRYLCPAQLRAAGMEHFDAFAALFGETVTNYELSPDGQTYRIASRFCRFRNLPELLMQWCQVADVRTADELGLDRPAIAGGAPKVLVADASPTQRAYIGTLVKRAEAIRNGGVDPAFDNMLAVTSDGRRSALDMRLVSSGAEDHAGSKVNLAVAEIARIWHETSAERATQLVFRDLGTPPSKGTERARSASFNVYADMRAKLIARGVAAQEIAFIHDASSDADKARLFAAMNAGRVRILFGSTEKCGAGTNVQARLIAEHSLDAPWRPRDVEQRRGRIERPGNRHAVVYLYRYVTSRSFDTYVWQGLERKQGFIAQIMKGDLAVRRAEEVDASVLSFTEIKALSSGHPLVLEKHTLDVEVQRLSRLKGAHGDQSFRVRYELAELPDRLASARGLVARLERDAASRVDTTGDAFAITLDGRTYTKRTDAAPVLTAMVDRASRDALAERDAVRRALGACAGFALSVETAAWHAPTLVLSGAETYRGEVERELTAIGLVQRVEHLSRSVERRLDDAQTHVAHLEKQRAELERLATMPFEHEEQLRALRLRQDQVIAALEVHTSDAQAMRADLSGADRGDADADDEHVRTQDEDDDGGRWNAAA